MTNDRAMLLWSVLSTVVVSLVVYYSANLSYVSGREAAGIEKSSIKLPERIKRCQEVTITVCGVDDHALLSN